MKKLLSLVMVMAIMCSMLTACGNADQPETTVPTMDPEAETTTPATSVETEPSVAPELITYPLNSDSSYTALAQELPALIYTTTGAENGLGGTIYQFSGTVVDYFTNGEDPFIYENIVVDTGDGNVLITNMYKATYNATLLELGSDLTKAYYIHNVNDFVFPTVGETASFVVVYAGYSRASEMPAFYLGANSSLYKMLDFDDPVMQSTAENSFTVGNLHFTLKDGQSYEMHEENAYTVSLDGNKAKVFIYAGDVSEMSVDLAEAFTDIQYNTLVENRTIVNSDSIDMQIAGFDEVADVYATITDDGSMLGCIDIAFTDTWYSYSVLFTCTTSGEDISEYASMFTTLAENAEYTGETPRSAD